MLRTWFGPKLVRNPEFRTKLGQKFGLDRMLTTALTRTREGASVILDDGLFRQIVGNIATYPEAEWRGYYAALRSTVPGVAKAQIDAVRCRGGGNAPRQSFAPVRQYAEEPREPKGNFRCGSPGCQKAYTNFDGLKKHGSCEGPPGLHAGRRQKAD